MTTKGEKDGIAIVGGGIGGLCLAIGLSNKDFKVTVYESASDINDVGAGILLGPNAIRALECLDDRLEECLQRIRDESNSDSPFPHAIEFRHGYHPSIPSEGPFKYAFIGAAVDPTDSLTPVSRSALLHELSSLLQPDTLHFGKRLESISDRDDGGMDLTFEDGTVARHRLVLGADGIWSQVRRHVLGPDNPNLQPQWTTNAGWRGRVPMAKAVEILGERQAKRNVVYFGKDCHVICSCASKGDFVNVIPMVYQEKWEHEKWKVPSSEDRLREAFKGWPQELLDLFEHIDCSTMQGLHHLPNTETFYRGKTAIMGDAAHAATPFEGSGASMAIEDAYVLSEILGELDDLDDGEAALATYDIIRRPRGMRLVETSSKLADILNYRDAELGHGLETIGADVAERFRWIWEEDLSAEVFLGKRLMTERCR